MVPPLVRSPGSEGGGFGVGVGRDRCAANSVVNQAQMVVILLVVVKNDENETADAGSM